MFGRRILLFAFALAAGTGYVVADNEARSASFRFGCKCGPTDYCWPAPWAWSALNASVSGKLIQNAPPAVACYPGPMHNETACKAITTELTNSTFVANNPIALDYPTDDGCPLPVEGQSLGTCTLGGAPVYSVNATCGEDVAEAINFARNHNIRLVVRNTGHDISGRSTGYGSLQVWMRHFREGITFQKQYKSSNKCPSSWKGSAFRVGGSYVWGDVYTEAQKQNVIVVGGGDPSVGATGGWAQGGGHSPASRDFGLGSDQILEAQVVTAFGEIVTANACENSDLYMAIRGGGGGTYGVVLSTVIKAHPQTSVVAQIIAMAPTSDAHIPDFMQAVATLYSGYPDMNDAGYSGYGSWAVNSYQPIVGNSTTGYNHVMAMFNKTVDDAQKAYEPFGCKIAAQNGSSIDITVSYQTFPTYWAYYKALSGGQGAVGSSAALGSHFFDRKALTSSKSALDQMLNTTAAAISTNIAVVSGGQVFADAKDKFSGVNPDWRTAYVHNIVAEGWAPGANETVQTAVKKDITNNMVGAMRKLAPNMGSYMNEADPNDPLFLKDFYGANVAKMQFLKLKYDPLSVFYCKTCIGSNFWEEDDTGRLCINF